MQGDTGPRSLVEKFFRMCLCIFAGVILLVLAIELLKSIRWILVIVAVVIAVTAALMWWWRRRNTRL